MRARAGMPGVRRVASFHGNLTTPLPAKAGEVRAREMVFHGAEDQRVGSVPDFQQEMRTAGVDWQFVTHGGAVPSFTVKAAGNDKSSGMGYDEKAGLRSWAMLGSFAAACLVD
ncbi:MAG: dienelactone hydrolase family protein [Planctomycetes bacterium]|nr:dienelactone hydrolase family protein [Planctomycetota bacterium]